jgi:hypothetical protein
MTDRKGTVVRSVVSKAAVILLSFRDGASYSLTEIVNVTGLPRSTAYRLICELVTWRMLERVDDGGYRLGLSLRLIGMRATDARNDLQACAPVVLQDLCEVLDAEVRLGILHNYGVGYIEKLPGARPACPQLGGHVARARHRDGKGAPRLLASRIRRNCHQAWPSFLHAIHPDRSGSSPPRADENPK